jgi:hypothetical protein
VEEDKHFQVPLDGAEDPEPVLKKKGTKGAFAGVYVVCVVFEINLIDSLYVRLCGESLSLFVLDNVSEMEVFLWDTWQSSYPRCVSSYLQPLWLQ